MKYKWPLPMQNNWLYLIYHAHMKFEKSSDDNNGNRDLARQSISKNNTLIENDKKICIASKHFQNL
jgi:hypothetical protein